MVSRRMKTTPAMACMKTLLAVFTFVFLAIGVAVLVFGVYAKIALQSYLTLSSIDYTNAPYVMIAVGAFITIVGLVGCCATFKDNTCLLRTYGCLLGLVFIVELVGAVIAVIFRAKIDKGFQVGFYNSISNYTTNKNSKQSVDDVQTKLHCCGSNNYTDYEKVGWAHKQYPVSCCKNTSEEICKSESGKFTVPTGKNDTVYVYDKGCYTLVSNKVKENLAVIIGSMFGIAFFQVIGLLLACCLASTINSNNYELV